jgi:hypothetical protein
VKRFLLWTMPVFLPGYVVGVLGHAEVGVALAAVACFANLMGYAEARRFTP